MNVQNDSVVRALQADIKTNEDKAELLVQQPQRVELKRQQLRNEKQERLEFVLFAVSFAVDIGDGGNERRPGGAANTRILRHTSNGCTYQDVAQWRSSKKVDGRHYEESARRY